MEARLKLASSNHSRMEAKNASIDPRAAIDPTASIAPGCTLGPFCAIGPNVRLGPGCTVEAHAVVQGPATLGSDNVIHAFACIGGSPQDRRHQGEATGLLIGQGNVFREHVTVNRGTVHGGGNTVIGDGNFLMAYAHVAHDCNLGNNVTMANHATLAGHTVVEDHVVFGGMVAVGTFLRIGESAMLAAGALVERDVPPFCIVAGDRARLRAINRVGLDRRNVDVKARHQIKSIFRLLKDRGRPLSTMIAEYREMESLTPEAERMLHFLEGVRRGITR